jgi:hypothetical protein
MEKKKQMLMQRKQKIIAIALVLTLALSLSGISVLPVNAATTITLQWQSSHQLIGVNQPIVLGLMVSAASFASVYGVTWTQLPTSLVYVWPNAYVIFTRPDGTNMTKQGPFELGVAHRPRFEFTPDMVGTWKALFVFPGDKFYNPATIGFEFTVQQQPIPKRETWGFINTRPDKVIGLNQWLLINAWVTPPPLTGSEIFKEFSFTITKPDATTVKIGPMPSEGEGTVWFEYPMDRIGQWTIKFDFPGDIHNKPCTQTKTVTVQQEQVPIGYPDTPLPTEEWTFPINTQNRDWRNIAGPWYMVNYNSSKGAFNPYTEAPKSAHILWKTEAISGMGGFIGSPHSVQTGGGEVVYGGGDRGIFAGSVANIRTVMAGYGYYVAGSNIVCVDMRTGETVWSTPGSFTFGAIRNGVPALYQIGSRFITYDGLTGAMTLNVTGMSMAANLCDAPYVFSAQNYVRFEDQLTVRGTTLGTEVPLPTPRLIKWTTEGTTTNFTERIIWNVSLPVNHIEDGWITIIDGLVVGVDWYANRIQTYKIWALNETTGQTIYMKAPYNEADPNSYVSKQGPMIGSGYGKLYWAALPNQNQALGWTSYDVATGNLAWVSEKTGYPWGVFWAYMPEACGYGLIYGLSYDGVYAFNATNGRIAWHYTAQDPYHETPYNQYVFGSAGPMVGGGMVFAPETEHSPTFVYRGQELKALDAITGREVWSIEGVYTLNALAYGVLLASDSYNGFSYAFGKGSTETTVSIASKTLPMGTPVLIEGTVSDQSSAQKGTPAISDASMTAWMQYLHMQQAKPANATGVQVKLTATDPNGNYQNIGTATSDIFGNYAISWNPPVAGIYKVTATFQGSESYYGSDAGTSFVVAKTGTAANVVPTQQQSQTASPTSSPASTNPSQSFAVPSPSEASPPASSVSPTTTYIAIGVAVVIIVAAAAALLLRRRK